MASLLVLVVLLTLVTSIISTLGAPALNQLLWSLYTRIPTSTSAAVVKGRVLRSKVLELRRTLAGTSSQDEFAKWAKIRRTLDKKEEDLAAVQNKIQSVRSAFDTKAGVARWILTTGMRVFLQFWYSRQPMFWLPQGWLPGYIEWLVSFPKAPIGSVSIQTWSFAVGQVVTLIFAVLAEVLLVYTASRTKKAATTPPMQNNLKTPKRAK